MLFYHGVGPTSAPSPPPSQGAGGATASTARPTSSTLAFVIGILVACCIWFVKAPPGTLPPAFNWFPHFTGLCKKLTIARTDIFRGMNAAPWSTYGFCNNIFPVWDFRIHRIASTHANHFVISVTVTIQWSVETAALWKVILKLDKKVNIFLFFQKVCGIRVFFVNYYYCLSVMSHVLTSLFMIG